MLCAQVMTLDHRIEKLTGDLRAMLADGELDRAAYNLPDLRDAVALRASCDEAVAAALRELDNAFEEERLPQACGALERLMTLL
jgi:hypothetical protein